MFSESVLYASLSFIIMEKLSYIIGLARLKSIKTPVLVKRICKLYELKII